MNKRVYGGKTTGTEPVKAIDKDRDIRREGRNRQGSINFFRSTIKEKDKEKENDRDTDKGREIVCQAPSWAFRVRCSQICMEMCA